MSKKRGERRGWLGLTGHPAPVPFPLSEKYRENATKVDGVVRELRNGQHEFLVGCKKSVCGCYVGTRTAGRINYGLRAGRLCGERGTNPISNEGGGKPNSP